MPELIYLDAALDDLDGIFRHAVLHGGPELGASLTDGVRQQCRRLARLPGLLGCARLELLVDMRSFPVSPCILFFRYEPESLVIVNILHASRDIDAFFNEGP